MAEPHVAVLSVESAGDQWYYRLTCGELGCGGVIYEGGTVAEVDAERAVGTAAAIHAELCSDKVIVRPPIIDRDYERLVYLLGNREIMESFGGPVPEEKVAHHLVEMRRACMAFPYAEQLVVARETGIVVSIVGAKRIGTTIDFTWRTDPHPDHKRKGYAEAGSKQILELWDKDVRGVIFARIGKANDPSKNLATKKLGFVRADQIEDEFHRYLYRRDVRTP